MAKGLTPKQKRFCEEYLIDLNATQAYIRAGYSVKNENSAAASATELLRNPKIKAHIAGLRQKQQKRTEITADKVIAELAHIAFARMSNVVSVNRSVVEIKDFDKLGGNELAAIAQVKTRQIVTEDSETFDTDIKMHSKEKALELLMKHMGMLTDFNVAVATLDKFGYDIVRRDADS